MKTIKYHKNTLVKSKKEAERFIKDFYYNTKRSRKNITARQIKKIILERYEERFKRCNSQN